MAEQYTGNGYKIWINREDTRERITNENIWVGNKPRDGKSKVSSGLTGADRSYVIFDSWNDLVDAIGGVQLSISADTLSVTDQAATVPIDIFDCNCEWTLSSNQAWATLQESDKSGVGNKNDIILTIEEYDEGTTSRQVTVTASYGKGRTKSVVITQLPSGFLSLSAPEEVGPIQTNVNVVVSSNTGWTLSIVTGGSYARFIDDPSGNGNGIVQLQIDENTTTDNRDIVIRAVYGGKSKTITIVQGKTAAYLSITPETTSITQSRNVVLFTITSNIAWTLAITSGASYSRLDKTSGPAGTTQVSLTVSANTTSDSRQVIITATYDGDQTKSATVTQARSVPDPEIIVTADTTSIEKAGGESVVYMKVLNGTYSGYTITASNANADYNVTNVERIDSSTTRIHINFGFNDLHEVLQFTVKGYGKSDEDPSKTCSGSVRIDQFYSWALADVDYLIFTYEWSHQNGTDLDSVTFIDGLATSEYSTYGYTFEKGVGYSNGQVNGVPDNHQRYIGSSFSTALLKFAGDNTASGGEYTCVDFKRLNACIKDAVERGEVPPGSKIYVYLLGSWFDQKNDGNANIYLKAYKGGDVYMGNRDGYYYYDVSGNTQVKGEFTAENIQTFAFGNFKTPISNYNAPLKTYTTMAAFIYDYETSAFFMVDGEDLKTLDGGKRYCPGVVSNYTGDAVLTGEGNTIDKSFARTMVFEVTGLTESDKERDRVYELDINARMIVEEPVVSEEYDFEINNCESDSPELSVEKLSRSAIQATVHAGIESEYEYSFTFTSTLTLPGLSEITVQINEKFS